MAGLFNSKLLGGWPATSAFRWCMGVQRYGSYTLLRPLLPSSSSSTSKRTLTSSPCSALPHLSHPIPQHQQQAPPTSHSPPSPSPRPYTDIPKVKTVLGLNIDILRNPSLLADYMERSAKELGHIFRLVGLPGLTELVCVVDPVDVETAYRTGDNDYPMRFSLPDLIKARKELNRDLGMFLEQGVEWYKQRKPVSKFILMPRKMAEYHVPFNHVAQDFLQLLRKQRQDDCVLQDVVSTLNRWSLETVALFVLGRRLGCLNEDQMPPDCKQYVEDIRSFFLCTERLLFGLPFHKIWPTKNWKELMRSQKGVLDFTSDLVREKMDNVVKEGKDIGAELGMDFFTYMLHSGDMSAEQIAVNAIDLLGAGVDTTSQTVSGCLYSLATNPAVQDKLREEVEAVLGEEELVTPKHIQDMHYLRDTIKETMRLYPIVPNNTRVLKEDVVLSGYRVPAGATITMSTIVSGRLPEYFPEPEKFKPERWSRDNPEPPNSFATLPFGFGRRMCVGRRVAELEMHILLAQLVRNFRIEFREEEPIKYITKLFYGPERKMNLAFVDRK